MHPASGGLPTHRFLRRTIGVAVTAAAVFLAGCGSAPAGPAPTTTVTVTETVTAAPTADATPDAGQSPQDTEPGSSGEPAAERGVVTHVVDGDTIDVAGVGRIRYRGIDTPERGACGFDAAAEALTRLVLGRQVDLIDPGTGDSADRYGRLLRYVDVDGVDSGLALIKKGLAIARYDSRDGYGWHPREEVYIRADQRAADLC